MPKIKVLPHPELCPNGATMEAPSGRSICETLLKNGVEIEHACDRVCACTTCHVVVKEGFDSLSEIEENEEDLLDQAWGLKPTSRLSCQALVNDKDVVVEIPRYTINLAKEG
jgi:2Fe-2S ferredoxin